MWQILVLFNRGGNPAPNISKKSLKMSKYCIIKLFTTSTQRLPYTTSGLSQNHKVIQIPRLSVGLLTDLTISQREISFHDVLNSYKLTKGWLGRLRRLSFFCKIFDCEIILQLKMCKVDWIYPLFVSGHKTDFTWGMKHDPWFVKYLSILKIGYDTYQIILSNTWLLTLTYSLQGENKLQKGFRVVCNFWFLERSSLEIPVI